MATLSEYQAAFQAHHLCVADEEAASGKVSVDWLGQPKPYPGNYAITYRVEGTSRHLAVRCFHREPDDIERRYSYIVPVVRALKLDGVQWCQFRRKGVYAGGTWNPAVLMPWVPGVPINDALKQDLSTARVRGIRSGFRALVADLEAAGISHGDLQHGNLLVDELNVVRIVDYDAMHVPGMPVYPSIAGHPNFRHPTRPAVVGDRADRFSAMLIDLALHALEVMPGLWAQFDTGENLLFVRQDLLDPGSSALIRALYSDRRLQAPTEQLLRVLANDSIGLPSLHSSPESAGVTDFEAHYTALDPALISNVGDEVTVIGRPSRSYLGKNRRGLRYALVTFGSRRTAGFTLKSWESQIGKLPLDLRLIERVAASSGLWIAATGRLSAGYNSNGKRVPELRVERSSQVRVIESREAAQFVAGARDSRDRWEREVPQRHPVSRAETFSPFGKMEVDRRSRYRDALNRLYSQVQ